MATQDLCSEAEITALVHEFYADVRLDPQLGPIFNGHIDDWDEHLAKLVDFWSSLLRGTRRFSGSPMTKHVVLPELDAELFLRWLELFEHTTSRQPNQEMGQRALAMARRVAQSLWYGYQINRYPDTIPTTLPMAMA